VVAAERYEKAVEAVFRKWDADAFGRFEPKVKNSNCFSVFDLECCCCSEHAELRQAKSALDAALAALRAAEGEGGE